MILKLRNQRLISLATPRTTFSEDIFVGDTTLGVISDLGFDGNDKYLLFGNFGNEGSEIVSFTSALNNVLTCAAVTKPHPQGTPVYLLSANQVQFEYSSDNITYAVLDTIDINPQSSFTAYEDIVNIAGSARAIFYNDAAAATYQGYNEIIYYSLDTRKTRGFAKDVAAEQTGTLIDLVDITEDFLNKQVELCDARIRNEKINWAQEVERVSVTPTFGKSEYLVDNLIKQSYTIQNLLEAWYGDDQLTILEPADFRKVQTGVKTELAVAINNLAQVTVVVTDSTDLADSGTILIEDDEISYTGITRSTHTLTGVTGITALHAVTTTSGEAMEVWQFPATGTPSYLSMESGKLLIYPIPVSQTDIKRIRLTISGTYNPILLDSDILEFPIHLYVLWLQARIGQKRGDADWRTLQNDFETELMKVKARYGNAVTPSLAPFQSNIYPTLRRNKYYG